MDTRERIQGYDKDEVKAVSDDTQSAMPVFGPDRLSDSDLDDLVAICRRCGIRSAPSAVGRRRPMRSTIARSLVRPCRCSLLRGAVGRSSPSRRRRRARHRTRRFSTGCQRTASRWLTFGGNYTNHRHSPLTQITPDNVNRLVPQWTFQTGTLGNFETTSLAARQRAVCHRPAERRVGDRRAHRPPDLALPPRAAATA